MSINKFINISYYLVNSIIISINISLYLLLKMVFMKPSHSIEISWDTFRRGTRSFRVPGMSQDLGDPKYEDFLLRSFEQVEP